MTSSQTPDQQYLLAAFRWLRARFARLLEPYSNGQLEREAYEQRVAETWKNLSELRERNPPAVVRLIAGIQPPEGTLPALQEFELGVLLLCLGVQWDSMLAEACRIFHGTPDRACVTPGLARQLLLGEGEDSVCWTALAADQPLRNSRLIEVDQDNNKGFSDAVLTVTPWVAKLAAGKYSMDTRLERYVSNVEGWADDELANLFPVDEDGQLKISGNDKERVLRLRELYAANRHRRASVQLVGRTGDIHELYTRWLSCQAFRGRPLTLGLFHLKPETLRYDALELEEFCQLWNRELLWRANLLFLDAQQFDFRSGTQESLALQRICQGTDSPLFLSTPQLLRQIGDPVLAYHVNKPIPKDQCALWKQLLVDEDSETPSRLAGQFSLSFTAIRKTVAACGIQRPAEGIVTKVVLDESDEERLHPLHDSLWQECLKITRPHPNRLAESIDTKSTWDDIVVPDRQHDLLLQIVSQATRRFHVYDHWELRKKLNRGLGISALFTGESGTGKTMAAEVIANSLKLPLYRIDLSSVINKYIGETEKNLRDVFDSFEEGGAVLFFDEADSLFGKRSEVKDSHDRYSNIQIDYLLQRMEAFTGLVILATNMRSAIDPAFIRRLRFIVEFPFPEAAHRSKIWKLLIDSIPDDDRGEIDYEKLAGYSVAGGSILTVFTNALFQAAASKHRRLTMQHLLRSMKDEYRKMHRTVNEADFRLPKTQQGVA